MNSLFWLISLLAFLILLSLVGYLLVALFGYLLRSKPTARKVVQLPVTVLLSVAIGALLGGGIMSVLQLDIHRSPDGVGEAISALYSMFFGALLGLAVGIWTATKLWRRINLTSTARNDIESGSAAPLGLSSAQPAPEETWTAPDAMEVQRVIAGRRIEPEGNFADPANQRPS